MGKKIVIGAGLTGLVASYYNQDAIVYESSDRIGGRIFSINDNNNIDMGAQFFSEYDRNIMDFIDSLNLSHQLKEFQLKNFSAINREKNFERHLTDFSDEEKIELKKFKDITEIIEEFENDELISSYFKDWYNRQVGSEADWFIDALIRMITFSDSTKISAIYGIAVINSFFETCFSFSNGLSEIISTIHNIRSHNIYAKNRITNLKIKKRHITSININGKKMDINKNDKIISTIPAQALEDILENKDDQLNKTLKEIRYVSCTTAVFNTKKTCFPNTTGSVFLNTKITAAYENKNKFTMNKLENENGTIVSFIPDYSHNEYQSNNIAKKELINIYPDLDNNITERNVMHWKYGLPICSPNLFKNQKIIMEYKPKNLEICGDFMGLPSLDACVETVRKVNV
ncbi:FAD-dependent oxidoreductase [Candidatus Micrarchaeota archaeon]|nr:FAD-dependent oxidoreductase [Candidatus Micrarchaeota archaeon]